MLTYEIKDEYQLKMLNKWHADNLFETTNQNRNYLRQWLSWVDATKSSKQSLEFITAMRQAYMDHSGYTLGIFHKDKIIGCVGFNRIDWTNRKTDIGYWLAEEYTGRGIMTCACEALLSYAFEELCLNRVEIRAAVMNRKSRAIPERLGFVQEGVIRQAEWLHDEYVDHVIYSMLQADWQPSAH